MDLKRIVAKGIKTIFNPAALTNCQVNKNAKICSGTQMNNSSINRYSYCGHDCFILNCDIGSFVSIADNCRLGGAMHPIERVSSSPVFHKGKNVLNKNFAKFDDISDKKIVISSDVWIGAGVTVLSGITIGVGAVVAGNPAKKIRNRFDEETSKELLQTTWWEWNDETIGKYSHLFDNPQKFIETIKEK